jgi:hypothetical protein
MINMKKRVNLIVFSLVLTALLAVNAIAVELTPSTSVIPGTSNLAITSLRYEPYPVSPGEQFDLWIKVDNQGASSANNATCILSADYPFSIYQGTSTKSYGKLNAGESIVFQFKLKTDEKAVQGSNELQIQCTRDPSAGSWQTEKLNVLIQTRYPTLNIKEVRTDPKTISPGEDATLLFTLENLADSPMKDIDIQLNLAGIDIVSNGEVAEKKLRMINTGGVADVMFSIKAMPESKGGIYKVPFTLTYTDNLGKSYTQTGLISVEVSSKPDLILSIDSTTLSKSSKLGDVDIKITNKGLTDLKFVTVEILDSNNFKILSSNIVYIGDIDSDDFGTASFKLSAKTGNSFDIPLKISLRDVLSSEYSETVNVNLKMLSAGEMGKKSFIWSIIPTILIIFVILMIFVRSFREKVKNLFLMLKRK